MANIVTNKSATASDAKKMLFVILRYEYLDMARMTSALPAIEKNIIGIMNMLNTIFCHGE